ncbi:hypothetical protein OUZ56_032173 [Daphnia magna]|uniref:Secreted protein n=1 Tax=Daphnia magna TaxID=35525 RepID=A0ABQ9ZWD8_9CRUS|nr:hypothetical protein OUZ56_032173 [Daphnia magna]
MEWFGLVFFLCSASGHLSSVSSTSNSLYGYRESEIASLLPQSLLRPYFYPSLKSYEARRSDEVTRDTRNGEKKKKKERKKERKKKDLRVEEAMHLHASSIARMRIET